MIVALLSAGLAALIYLIAGPSLGAFGVLIKTLPVAILAVWAGRSTHARGAWLGVCGLALSALADALIEWRFLAGLLGFLVVHLFYIGAFVRFDTALRLVRLVPALLWGVLALPALTTNAGSMAVPVWIYGLVILTMIWRAAAAMPRLGPNAPTLGFFGALIFGISDTVLGYERFVEPLAGSRLLVLSAYWSAQAMLASSFVLRESESDAAKGGGNA